MITVLSPAKKLSKECFSHTETDQKPQFLDRSENLVNSLKKLDPTNYKVLSKEKGKIYNSDSITRLNYVIDFIQLYYSSWYWPIFNVADASITIGAVLLIFAGSHFEKAA